MRRGPRRVTTDSAPVLDEETTARAVAAARALLEAEAQKPLVVAVMGQTGVGKSSLINALFGTDLATGAVKPTTKQLQNVTTENDEGYKLVFSDLPGLGEGGAADDAYLRLYREQLEAADVAIWAMLADSRSVAFDQTALAELLEGLAPEDQSRLFSKLVFVLTKADTATLDPWILGRQGRSEAVFAPPPGSLLSDKAAYFRDALIEPFGHLVRAQTYNDVAFNLDLPRFTSEEQWVAYEGYMGTETVDSLTEEYPEYSALFRRLADNYSVVPCSARFRFNLTELLLLVLNRLGPLAVGRFKHFLSVDQLDRVDFAVAREFRNFLIIDPRRRKVLLDVATAKL